MGFRVVDSSSFTFTTDLPASSRNIHPSGVLHAFRTTATETSISHREEHTFAWISDTIYIDGALEHLEKFGFDCSHGIVFIPYSTQRNWIDRYPHAAPALECDEKGKLTVFLNWRPYPNGLGAMNDQLNGAEAAVARAAAHKEDDEGIEDDDDDNDEDDAPVAESSTAASASGKKKRKYKSRALNMLQDNSFLPDSERDELHVEIYNYLEWLHGRLAEIETKTTAAAALATVADITQVIDPAILEEKKAEAAKSFTKMKGIDVEELKAVVEKLEAAFLIIPNIKGDAVEEEEDGGGEDNNNDGDTPAQKGAPFLEEALTKALNQLVIARESGGKAKRRSKKRKKQKVGNPRRSHDRAGHDFDLMFNRLEAYKEEYGDCLVSKNYKEDQQLANWVRGIREKRAIIMRKGIEVEVPEPGKPVLNKTLTAERLERLNSVGFQWSISGPKMAWEDRFKDLMEYYESHGKWPSQSMGSLGEWVHKQRGLYARNDKKYMATKAPKLDEVGFEWTPRGYTRMSWDEGKELLMEFGRVNGHFNVPCPAGENVDKKGDAHRLYKWVESLHGMYRSYKLGRQSGSLTDDRVVLLIKHGFVFRNK